MQCDVTCIHRARSEDQRFARMLQHIGSLLIFRYEFYDCGIKAGSNTLKWLQFRETQQIVRSKSREMTERMQNLGEAIAQKVGCS